MKHPTIYIGIDLGTTTISMVALDTETQMLIARHTVDHRGSLESPIHALQDGQTMVTCVEQLLAEWLSAYPNVAGIGLTGQMHGILYLDSHGQACSPLYTWQDLSAEDADGICYREEAYQRCGKTAPSGYGLMTHYVLQRRGEIPTAARSFCTIADYLGMRLVGRSQPLLHASMAASLGFYDVAHGRFETETLQQLEMNLSLLPACTRQTILLGTHQDIPVSVAFGDNQAAFLGACTAFDRTVLLNVGTGSQVSVLCDTPIAHPALETRPFLEDAYLCSYSALCGGYAYALLEQFFHQLAKEFGQDAPQYDLMARLAEQATDPLTVQPTFQGSRQDPSLRGSITNISASNFTPANLVRGVLEGMAEELYQHYALMPISNIHTTLIASGNGVRQNSLLQQILSDRFHLPLQMPQEPEEAALGAARFAAYAVSAAQ